MRQTIIDHITANGEQSLKQLMDLLSATEGVVYRAVNDLRDQAKIVMIFRDDRGDGVKRYFYGLPVKRDYPKIGASEYRHWAPSGTDPRSIGAIEHALK